MFKEADRVLVSEETLRLGEGTCSSEHPRYLSLTALVADLGQCYTQTHSLILATVPLVCSERWKFLSGTQVIKS